MDFVRGGEIKLWFLPRKIEGTEPSTHTHTTERHAFPDVACNPKRVHFSLKRYKWYGGRRDDDPDRLLPHGGVYPVDKTHDGTTKIAQKERRPDKHPCCALLAPVRRSPFYLEGCIGRAIGDKKHETAAAATTTTTRARAHLQPPQLREEASPKRDLQALGEVPGHQGQELEEEGLRQPVRRPVRLQQVPLHAKPRQGIKKQRERGGVVGGLSNSKHSSGGYMWEGVALRGAVLNAMKVASIDCNRHGPSPSFQYRTRRDSAAVAAAATPTPPNTTNTTTNNNNNNNNKRGIAHRRYSTRACAKGSSASFAAYWFSLSW